jgi:hypothetical protein
VSSSGATPFPWRKHWVRLGLLLALMVLPFVPTLGAKAYADAHGCQLHEGFANPCLVDGVDQGDMLYGLFVSGWLGAIAAAAGLIGLIIWAVALYGEMRRWGHG